MSEWRDKIDRFDLERIGETSVSFGEVKVWMNVSNSIMNISDREVRGNYLEDKIARITDRPGDVMWSKDMADYSKDLEKAVSEDIREILYAALDLVEARLHLANEEYEKKLMAMARKTKT